MGEGWRAVIEGGGHGGGGIQGREGIRSRGLIGRGRGMEMGLNNHSFPASTSDSDLRSDTCTLCTERCRFADHKHISYQTSAQQRSNTSLPNIRVLKSQFYKMAVNFLPGLRPFRVLEMIEHAPAAHICLEVFRSGQATIPPQPSSTTSILPQHRKRWTAQISPLPSTSRWTSSSFP